MPIWIGGFKDDGQVSLVRVVQFLIYVISSSS